MQAHKFRSRLEDIRSHVLELSARERDLQVMRERSVACGAQYGSIGHGAGAGDGSGPILRVMQADADLDSMRARVNAEIRQVLPVLYGHDNRGGLARMKGSAVADCICAYYLQGMTWPEVAAQFGWPDGGLDSKDGPQLCKRRAYRGIEKVELLGAEVVSSW